MAVHTGCNMFLMLSLLFILHLFVNASSQECSEKASLNPDGSIDWGKLPNMGKFKSSVNYTDDAERRGVLSDMARGFVNIVTPSVDALLEYLSTVIKQINDRYNFDIREEIQKAAGTMVGVIVCLCVGIAYLILVPIVGIIFGCCRCCNNCGGKRVQEECGCPGCLRVYYTIFLLCITGILCAGMAYTNFSNDFIQYTYKESNAASQDIIVDVQTFTTGTLQQIEYITKEEYVQVDCLIRDNINNVGNEIADPLIEYLKVDAGLQYAMDSFKNLTSDLNDTYVALDNINSSRSQVIDGTQLVGSLLEEVKQTYDVLSCTGCPDSTSLSGVADYSSISPVDDQLMAAFNAKVLAEELYNKFHNSLSNISTTIDESAQPVVEEVSTSLDTISEMVVNSFDSVSDTVKQLNGTLVDIKKTLIEWFKIADGYIQYGYYGLIGVTCLTLLIVLFNIIGIVMGTLSYKDVSPTERTRMSNAGGNVLIAGVFFSLLFGPILILICMALFVGSGTATLTCQPLSSFQLFEKTIDQEDALGTGKGYFLGDLLFQNSSVNLTVSSILTQCKNNASLYSALQLSRIFSLEELQKQLDQVKNDSGNSLEESIKMPPLDLVSSDLNTQLTDAVNNINLGSVNLTSLQLLLTGSNVTFTDLEAFAAQVTAASLNPSNSGIKMELENISSELLRIQDEYVNNINTHKTLIVDNAEILTTMNMTLDDSITNTVAKLTDVEDQVNLNSTTTKLQNITTEYVDRVFGYADQFVIHVNKQLENDLAKCLPLHVTYEAGVDFMCYYIFDSLNTLWFTTGWCAIFLLFSIFLAVKLAKYYRIMDEEALPKVKKSKKGSSRQRTDQEMALEDMSEDSHTGHDNIRLVESIRQGGMQPQQNPHYIPDDVINGYDSYNNLGRPMAPPPAYHPGKSRSSSLHASRGEESGWNEHNSSFLSPDSFDQAANSRQSLFEDGYNQHEMPPVNSYDFRYVQDPVQRRNRDSVMADMQQYNKKPRIATYL